MRHHLDRASACFVAYLLVAWGTFRMEELRDDQLFAVDHLQTVDNLGLVEALPCLLRNMRLVGHCMA